MGIDPTTFVSLVRWYDACELCCPSPVGLSTQNRMGMSEQDAFLSNIGMCMMTLYELEWPSPGGGEGWCPVGEGGVEDREAKGILSYIRMTHSKSDEVGTGPLRLRMRRVSTSDEKSKKDSASIHKLKGQPRGFRT